MKLPTTMAQEGNLDAKILFVGEAPSYMERKLGRPLAGPAGDVFNDCLHAAGLIRREACIINTWPYMVKKDATQQNFFDPDGNKIWTAKKGFTEKGLQDAQQAFELIKRSQANIIVPLGQSAFTLCAGVKRPIGKWRGSPLVCTNKLMVDGRARKMIPTYHPAATLRGQYVWRYLIISDFEKAKAEMDSPELILPDRRLITNPTFSDILEYFNYIGKQSRVATDLEVINHQVSCFCLCSDPSEAMIVPIGDEFGQPMWSEVQEMKIWKLYAEVMGDENIEKINQNIIGFDAPFLVQQNNIYTNGFLGDTMVAQHILYPDFPKGLDFITSVHTREPYFKDEGKMWKGMGGDIEQFWRYNGKDGCIALEAWDCLSEELTEGGYWPTYNMTARLHKPLTYMTIRGMKVDHALLQKTKERVETKLEKLYQKLEEVADYPFNPGSPKQCQQYFYIHKGITPYTGGTGKPTTDDKALARIARKYNLEEARIIQEIRKADKLRGTYLEVNFDKDGRLRCSWNPRGTWTGRLSSSQTVFDTGMNMQNLHPEFKEFLVADED